MFYFLVKRILMALLTLFVIMFISYYLLRKAPGDPTKSSFFGESQGSAEGMSQRGLKVVNKSLREKLHLDKPVVVGFAYWIKDIVLKGDLGESASVDRGRPVSKLIIERLPVTLRLNLISIFVIYLFAIPLGIQSAVSRGSKSDGVITFFLFFLYSLPGFWVALLLQALICDGGKYPLFPLKGLVVSNSWGMGTWRIFFETAMHYVLPVLCLSYSGFAGLSRYARAGMLDVIKQDYIRTARAKGLPEHVVIFKHAFRNALITMITLFAGLLPGLIAGSIILEFIFNIPGMGTLSMLALSSRDIPLLMALFGFGSALTLLGILAQDILYCMADPRIKIAK